MIGPGRLMRSQLPRDFYGRAHAMTGEPRIVEALVDRAVSLRGADWVPLWTAQAAYWEREAQAARQLDDPAQETRALRRACAYSLIATYPWIGDEERWQAYASARALFRRACERDGIILDVLDIALGKHRLRAAVQRLPGIAGVQPVILFLRGLDSTKEVAYWDERLLLERGWAVVSVDFPGMGENTCALSPDTESQFQAVLDALSPGGAYAGLGLATDRTVAWGLGFGGYWAFKLAAVDPRVTAAINIGGPVHHAFAVSVIRYLRFRREIDFLKNLFLVALGSEFTGSVARFIRQLSLVQTGILARLSTPLLYINGDQDLAVTSREAAVVRHCRPRGDTVERQVWMVPGAGHLAIEKLNGEVLPRCLDWLDWLENRSSSRSTPGKNGPAG